MVRREEIGIAPPFSTGIVDVQHLVAVGGVHFARGQFVADIVSVFVFGARNTVNSFDLRRNEKL